MTGQGPLHFNKNCFIKGTVSSWSWMRSLVFPKTSEFITVEKSQEDDLRTSLTLQEGYWASVFSAPGLGGEPVIQDALEKDSLVLSVHLAVPVSGQADLALIFISLRVLICKMKVMPFTSVAAVDEGNIYGPHGIL